jgi:hypothetical protein
LKKTNKKKERGYLMKLEKIYTGSYTVIMSRSNQLTMKASNRKIEDIKNKWLPDASRNFWVRFWTRNEDKENLARCLQEINDALGVFNVGGILTYSITLSLLTSHCVP